MRSRFLFLWVVAAFAVAALIVAPTAHVSHASASGVVISAMYGGGNDTGAPYTHDYIELFNGGTRNVDITGWSVQYRHAADGSSWQKTQIVAPTILQPGQYYLIQADQGDDISGVALPTPDNTNAADMRRPGQYVVALVSTGDTIQGDDPRTDPQTQDDVVDLFGGGHATTTLPTVFEGAPRTGILDATLGWFRANDGCQDTDNNLNDFAAGSVAGMARNTTTALAPCAPTSDLVVAVTDIPDPVLTTNAITYTVNVQNIGNAAAANALISVGLTGGAYPGIVTNLSDTTNCEFTNPTVSCTVASIPDAGSFTFSFEVTPAVTGTVTANANVSADVPETTGNNTDSETTTVNEPVPTTADVSVTIADSPDPVNAGSPVGYTVTVNNTGTEAAANTHLTVNLGGAAFPGTIDGLAGTGCSFTNPTITCTIGTLAVTNGTTDVTFSVTPTVAGTITVDATVAADAPETAGNNTDSETTTVTIVIPTVGSFELVSPASDDILRAATTTFTWTEAAGATTYDVYVSHLSNNTRIGETYTITKNSGDVCAAGVCSLASSELVASLEQGTHSWTVVASNAPAQVEASNAPALFTVDLDGIELVANGGLEDNGAGWTFSQGAKRKCKAAWGNNSDCAFKLKPKTNAQQRGVMGSIFSATDTAAGDVLQVSAAVRTKKANKQRVVMVVIKYVDPNAGAAGNGKDKFKMFVQQATTGYETFSENFVLAGAAKGGRVVVANTLTAGTLRVDDVSVVLMPVGATPRADAPASVDGLLPVPAAPDSFRGSN